MHGYRNEEYVSIHAPAWGATGCPKCAIDGKSKFQSTLPRGERLLAFGTFFQEDFMFQSTLPRGERPLAALLAASSEVFQSTLPRGERPTGKTIYRRDSSVSIHAPAWGATYVRFLCIYVYYCFNPRSRVGSDRLISKRLIMSNI